MDVALPDPDLSLSDEIQLARAALADPIVIFGISLKGKKDEESWASVEANLDNTIANLARQADQNFLVLVAGHTRPKLSPESEARCIWLQASWPIPTHPTQYSEDKRKKRFFILRTLKKAGIEECYFFTLDADDYLHPHVTKHIRADHNKQGYYIPKGYIYDIENHVLAKLAPMGAPFYKHCGSCVAIWNTAADYPKGTSDKTTIWWELRDHTRVPEIAQRLDRTLAPLPFYAGLYLFNHGANNLREKNNDGSKMSLINRRAIGDSEEVTKILRRFHVKTRQKI